MEDVEAVGALADLEGGALLVAAVDEVFNAVLVAASDEEAFLLFGVELQVYG